MSESMAYRHKPAEVEAFQWTPGCELPDWAEDDVVSYKEFAFISVGSTTADPGDYVIRGVEGEIYSCSPGIFDKTYEPVSELGVSEETMSQAGAKDIEADARRWQYVRDNLAQMNSPKMHGQHTWRFRTPYYFTGNTIASAIDKAILAAAEPEAEDA